MSLPLMDAVWMLGSRPSRTEGGLTILAKLSAFTVLPAVSSTVPHPEERSPQGEASKDTPQRHCI